MSKKYSDTENHKPVLGAFLLEGLFAELMVQVKSSLDCCVEPLLSATELTLEQNIVVVANVAKGEVAQVVDILQNHSEASLNKKHRYFVRRLRQFHSDIKDLNVTIEHHNSLKLFLKLVTMWLQDSHIIMDEETSKPVREYVGSKGNFYDKTAKEHSLYIIPGGRGDGEEGGSEGNGVTGGKVAEGAEGDSKPGADGSSKSGVGKRVNGRKPGRKAQLKLANDSSLEDEREVEEGS